MEQLGLKSAPTWDAGLAGNGLNRCATMPVPSRLFQAALTGPETPGAARQPSLWAERCTFSKRVGLAATLPQFLLYVCGS